MKKILLGLGASASILVPVMSTISCSSGDKETSEGSKTLGQHIAEHAGIAYTEQDLKELVEFGMLSKSEADKIRSNGYREEVLVTEYYVRTEKDSNYASEGSVWVDVKTDFNIYYTVELFYEMYTLSNGTTSFRGSAWGKVEELLFRGSGGWVDGASIENEGGINISPEKILNIKTNYKTPENETPDVETPDVEIPDVETPVVETPVVETPVVETPKRDFYYLDGLKDDNGKVKLFSNLEDLNHSIESNAHKLLSSKTEYIYTEYISSDKIETVFNSEQEALDYISEGIIVTENHGYIKGIWFDSDLKGELIPADEVVRIYKERELDPMRLVGYSKDEQRILDSYVDVGVYYLSGQPGDGEKYSSLYKAVSKIYDDEIIYDVVSPKKIAPIAGATADKKDNSNEIINYMYYDERPFAQEISLINQNYKTFSAGLDGTFYKIPRDELIHDGESYYWYDEVEWNSLEDRKWKSSDDEKYSENDKTIKPEGWYKDGTLVDFSTIDIYEPKDVFTIRLAPYTTDPTPKSGFTKAGWYNIKTDYASVFQDISDTAWDSESPSYPVKGNENTDGTGTYTPDITKANGYGEKWWTTKGTGDEVFYSLDAAKEVVSTDGVSGVYTIVGPNNNEFVSDSPESATALYWASDPQIESKNVESIYINSHNTTYSHIADVGEMVTVYVLENYSQYAFETEEAANQYQIDRRLNNVKSKTTYENDLNGINTTSFDYALRKMKEKYKTLNEANWDDAFESIENI